ncbi:hypothetical protein CF326_g8954 [Tilletia indica]|nr:hypothetical protein CF326_g8954 [Tilletia indica]
MTSIPLQDVLDQSDIWLAFCGHIQNRYPAALSELEALLNIEPRPTVCVPDDLDVKDTEYDALIWAVTALWPSINGDACWGAYDLQWKIADSLANALQQDALKAALQACGKETPPSAYNISLNLLVLSTASDRVRSDGELHQDDAGEGPMPPAEQQKRRAAALQTSPEGEVDAGSTWYLLRCECGHPLGRKYVCT